MTYQWIYNDSFENINALIKFNNWLGEEFTLYQQDNGEGLTVFFPNGWFSVKERDGIKTGIGFRIEIHSACTKTGIGILSQVKSVLNHFKCFHQYS